MNKEGFIQELQECLYGEVDNNIILDSVSYYRSYIEEQIGTGKSEQQVLEELGDAAFIAKSIIDANESGNIKRTRSEEETVHYGDPYEEMEKQERRQNIEKKTSNILHWIIGIAILIVVITVVGTIAKILLPFIVVLAVVLFIKRLFDGRY